MFPKLARTFTLLFVALSLPRFKEFYKAPIQKLDRLAKSILKYTIFTSGAIGSSWGAICLFQQLLPRHTLATQRFFFGGFLGGLWGFVIRNDAKAQFFTAARASIDSLWKVGRKHGWWRGIRGGDVWLFVASLMVINVVFSRDPRALRSGAWRKGLSSLRGEGLRDRVAEEDKRIQEEEKGEEAKSQ